MGALDNLVAPQENTKKAPSQLPAKKSSSLDDLLSARRPVAELPQNVVQPPQPSMTFPVDSSKGQVTRGLPGPRLSTLAASRSPLVVPQAPNAPMVFSVGEGLNNRTDVLPGPRVSTLQAINRGEDVNVTNAPVQSSEVTRAKQAVGIQNLTQAPAITDKIERFGIKTQSVLDAMVSPDRNILTKMLQEPVATAVEGAGTVIGGVVGGIGNVVTSVAEGHPVIDTEEHTAKFWKDVIDTARSTGQFGREIGEKGAEMGAFGLASEVGGVFGETINALGAIPQMTSVYSDVKNDNVALQTGINAGMSLLFGLSAGRSLPEFARSIRSKANANTIVSEAADVLGIPVQKDVNGVVELPPQAIVDDAYRAKIDSGVKNPFQIETAKSVLTDRAVLPDEQFSARYEQPLLKIADAIDGNEAPEALPEAVPIDIVEPTGKASRVGKSIEQKAIEQNLARSFSETAEYTPITIKDQAARASTLINDDFERTMRIVRGEEKLPDGLRAGALIVGLEERIKQTGDAQLALDLANSPLVSETSLHAQELRLLAEREPESAVANLQLLKKAKEQAAEKRGAPKAEAVVSEIKKAVEKTKRERATKETWDSFITSITC